MRKLFVVFLTLALTIGLVSCKDDANDSGTTSTSTPAATTSTTPAATTAGAPIPTVEGEPTVTSTGLKIYEIKEGDGKEAVSTDTVTVNYTGWLDDGTVFDATSLHTPPDPSKFALNQVIPGWTEGIPGMKIGGKRRLVIPPELAYGASGRSGIPPNATLTFDVELVSIP